MNKRIKKKSKTHRNVLDKNYADVREIEALASKKGDSLDLTVERDIKKETVCLLVQKMNKGP